MVTALYPGTFDPPTLGHINIIERGCKIFDKLYIGIAQNSLKNGCCFSMEEKVQLMKKACTSLPKVEVVMIDGLLIDFIKAKSVSLILRGIRTGSEFDREIEMAAAHREMAHIETVALFSELPVSSTIVREIGLFGGPLDRLVPPSILEEVTQGLRG